MSVEGPGPGLQRSEEHPRKGPQRVALRCFSTSELGGKHQVRKEGGWAGEEAGRQMMELVSFLGRRILRAEVWY